MKILGVRLLKKRKFKIMKYKNGRSTICKVHKELILMADYSASGLWCKECGIAFGDPKEEFPNLPSGLVDLIDVWNGYWEAYTDEASKYNYIFLHNIYCQAGEYLAKLVNEFYPCTFEDYRGSEDNG